MLLGALCHLLASWVLYLEGQSERRSLKLPPLYPVALFELGVRPICSTKVKFSASELSTPSLLQADVFLVMTFDKVRGCSYDLLCDFHHRSTADVYTWDVTCSRGFYRISGGRRQ
jgi:hypothetical protein